MPIHVRAPRQRPNFAPLVLPSRPLIPVCELPLGGAAQCQTSNALISPATTSVVTIGKHATPKCCSHGRFVATEIVRGLFLGSSSDAAYLDELERRNIRFILNVATECEFTEEAVRAEERNILTLKKVHLIDHSDHDISRAFDECNHFILGALQHGHGVLVHCRMGVSRSAAIVIGFLMQYGGIYYPKKMRSGFNSTSNTTIATAASATADGNVDDRESAPSNPEPTTLPHRMPSELLTQQQDSGKLLRPSSSSPQLSYTRPNAPVEEHLKVADAKRTFPLSYSDSFDIVKERRHEIAPNLGFCLALRQIDVERGLLDDLWDLSTQ